MHQLHINLLCSLSTVGIYFFIGMTVLCVFPENIESFCSLDHKQKRNKTKQNIRKKSDIAYYCGSQPFCLKTPKN